LKKLLNIMSWIREMNSWCEMSGNEQSPVRNRKKRPRKARKDRRIQRTRTALHQALISLILERGYDAVTIKDVVDRANVGRSTFYAHYPSKEDLLAAEVHDLRVLLATRQRAALARRDGISERSLGFSRAFFEHAQDYRDIYRALVGERGATLVIARIRALLTELVREELFQVAPAMVKPEIPRSALIQFLVGSLMSILTWWLELKPSLAAAEVDVIFRQLTNPAIEVALGSAAPETLP
jgi:AcrR family transcriptional regulator